MKFNANVFKAITLFNKFLWFVLRDLIMQRFPMAGLSAKLGTAICCLLEVTLHH